MCRAVSYVRSAVEFNQYRLHLKSVPCPHCRAVGNLNRHGYLRGYEEEGSERVVRGWRIFCSNRGHRRGCGRTHSALLANCLRRRTVRASRLWSFFGHLKSGMTSEAAWEKISSPFSLQCGQRLWSSFVRTQSRIRSLLCRVQLPPTSSLKDSFLQTVEHLHTVFCREICPIQAFQIHFQKAFLI